MSVPVRVTGAAGNDEHGWPFYDRDEIEAAAHVLASGRVNYWTGEEGRNFEREFAARIGSRHAVAVSSGSVALELALRALGIGPGGDVVVSPRGFIASASCAVAVGARPVFADVDPDSQNITAGSIARVLTPATRAIVAVHFAGWPCEMDGILELARERDLKVVEDCAQAHGATYKGRVVGSIGHAGAFSFCQDKIVSTAGEGGMVTMDPDDLYEVAWAYKDHGKSYDAVFRRQHPPGFRWQHESFGTNWRMTEVQSAIGRLQLRKLSNWLEARRRNAAILQTCFAELPGLRVPVAPAHAGQAFYKCFAFVLPEQLQESWNRDRIAAELALRGVACNAGGCGEIYLEKAFPGDWRPEARLPVARELGETSLAFAVHPTLSSAQLTRTCEAVSDVMHMAAC